MIISDHGYGEIPAGTVEHVPPNVRQEWPAIGRTYNGKLENGKLTGAWQQGGGALPLVLERNTMERSRRRRIHYDSISNRIASPAEQNKNQA
jgi:hypothetical protein